MATASKSIEPKTFEVWLRGCEGMKREVVAETLGKAKSAYLLDISDPCPDVRFTEIEGRRIDGPFIPDADTLLNFDRVIKHRNIPFARLGMVIQIGDQKGIIVGTNSAMNLQVFFTSGQHRGRALSCHPHFKTKYFDRCGVLLKEFDD